MADVHTSPSRVFGKPSPSQRAPPPSRAEDADMVRSPSGVETVPENQRGLDWAASALGVFIRVQAHIRAISFFPPPASSGTVGTGVWASSIVGASRFGSATILSAAAPVSFRHSRAPAPRGLRRVKEPNAGGTPLFCNRMGELLLANPNGHLCFCRSLRPSALSVAEVEHGLELQRAISGSFNALWFTSTRDRYVDRFR